MGYDVNPNDSDLRMATVVLQYGVFPTLDDADAYWGATQPNSLAGMANILSLGKKSL